MSTNLTNFQEISGEISRRIQDMFALLRPAMNVPNLLVCLNIEQKHDMHNMGCGKDKKGRPVS